MPRFSAFALRVERALADACEEASRAGRPPWVSTQTVARIVYRSAPHVRTWAGRNAAVSNALHDLAYSKRVRASLGPHGETWMTPDA